VNGGIAEPYIKSIVLRELKKQEVKFRFTCAYLLVNNNLFHVIVEYLKWYSSCMDERVEMHPDEVLDGRCWW
jgi:hypothetical protein